MVNFVITHFKRAVSLLLVIALPGCASHLDRLSEAVSVRAGQIQIIRTSEFDLVSASTSETVKTDVLRVYIEGDGKAWSTRTQPSTDPSPRNLFMVNLALSDPHPSVYLARPCQFHKSVGCGISLWTDRRFSTPVIRSLHDALNALKARQSAQSLELIGYSGGGYLALLLADERTDVSQVQTIAGNLDPAAWAQHHQLSPLHGLKPIGSSALLRMLPQRHFIGTEDKVVPPASVEAFIRENEFRCASVTRLVTSHDSDWPGLARALNAEVTCQ
ncbi:alpha/beta hydrolase [Pseudomonas sp. 9Ag]|uniref:alpha/beta hydrolase n=1 Tax=Pseudomonas sp. 9Ag TaxID=2653167 RepID=UPI0012F16469|nr:alpha/beta hydrolase [Pseudomonas sp. 9Ag]VXC51377.1 Alpha/beta hydrolase family protein [Pseudomonas sp. 9Ag]